VAYAGTANKATHGKPDAGCRSHEEREGVRRNAGSTGVAAGGDHGGMFAVLPGSLHHAPAPDLLHILSVGPLMCWASWGAGWRAVPNVQGFR
jgi:hypothetical protein